MKTKFTLAAFPDEPCDNCGKTPSLQFWRAAKRHEREHFVFNLCAACLTMAREELLAQIAEALKP